MTEPRWFREKVLMGMDGRAYLRSLAGRRPDPVLLNRLAAELGSDVPFFLMGGPALAEGKGEILSPVAWQVPSWQSWPEITSGLCCLAASRAGFQPASMPRW